MPTTTTQKRKRTQFDRDLETTRSLQGEIASLYRMARKHGYAQQWILDQMTSRIWTARYRKLPYHWRSEITGYHKALADVTASEWTQHMYRMPDGKLVDTRGCYADSLNINHPDFTPQQVCELHVESGMFWKENLKPYFVTVKEVS